MTKINVNGEQTSNTLKLKGLEKSTGLIRVKVVIFRGIVQLEYGWPYMASLKDVHEGIKIACKEPFRIHGPIQWLSVSLVLRSVTFDMHLLRQFCAWLMIKLQ